MYNYSVSLDIDECKSFPCGPKNDNNCTNFRGYHECGACGEGFFTDPKNEKKCIGMYKIELTKWKLRGCSVDKYRAF